MTGRECSAIRTAKETVKHKTRRLTVSSAGNYPEYVPFAALRIKGKWLEAAGFPVDTQVEIVVEDGRRVVTALPKPEKPVVVEDVVVSALAVRKARELKKFMDWIEKKRA